MGYRYIGSKARIAEDIISYIGSPTSKDGLFIDAFSGTGVVASAAADHGWAVKVNDIMRCATIMSEAQLLSSDNVPFALLGGYSSAISQLNSCEGKEGVIWREYSPASLRQIGTERKYFTEDNAYKIDGILGLIHKWKEQGIISSAEFSLLIATLISAVNNVANIAGTYGCFLSKWTEASQRPIQLTSLSLRKQSINYCVSNQDVFQIKSSANDVVYLDPPYTKRQYAAYYHILETMAIGDYPTVEGVSGLRPWKHNASIFCYKTKALEALTDLIIQQQARRVLVSYSNDGHIKLADLESVLTRHGKTTIIELGTIGRYRPNQMASANQAEVKEYLIDFSKFQEGFNEQTTNI